jgi:hypothetical protein
MPFETHLAGMDVRPETTGVARMVLHNGLTGLPWSSRSQPSNDIFIRGFKLETRHKPVLRAGLAVLPA